MTHCALFRLRFLRARCGGTAATLAASFFPAIASAQSAAPAVVPAATVSDEKAPVKVLLRATLLRGAFSTPAAQRAFDLSVVAQSEAMLGAPFTAWMVDEPTAEALSSTVDTIDAATPVRTTELPSTVYLVVSGRQSNALPPCVRIGPMIVAREELLPNAWWSFDVVLPSAPDVAPVAVPSADKTPVANESREAATVSKTHPTSDSVTDFPKSLVDCHWKSVATLKEHGCFSRLIAPVTAPATEPLPVPAQSQPAATTLPPLEQPFLLRARSSTPLEVAVWFEMMDALQLTMRKSSGLTDINHLEHLKAADAAVEDMRAMARLLRCPSIIALIDERLPRGDDRAVSLTAHKTWPQEAWVFVDAVAEVHARADRTRAKLLMLAKAAAKRHGLAEGILKSLEERLEIVLAKWPINVEITAADEDAIADRLDYALDPTLRPTLVRVGDTDHMCEMPTPLFIDPNEVVAGQMRATTVAWEIYGYAWSSANTLLPSEAALLRSQRDQYLAVLPWAVQSDEFFLRRYAEPGRWVNAVLHGLDGYFDTRWKPWTSLPLEPAKFTKALAAWKKGALRTAGSGPDWGPRDFSCELDDALSIDAFVPTAGRGQPFADCWPFSTGSIGLYKR